ncbi:Adenylate cyclase type 10, partial [Rhizopus stolonifer]
MVDVVGFSSLTTMAQAKGDSGAEAIAMEIGAYMGECIQIIEFYGGDVVKARNDENNEAFERQKSLLVRKGIECGLQLLARLSHYRVYLTAEERSKHRTPNGDIRKEIQKQTIYDAMNSNFEHSSDPAISESSGSVEHATKRNKPTTFEENNFLSIDNWMPGFMKRRKHLKNSSRRKSDASELSNSNSMDINNCIDLELHMSLSCGDITNIVLGNLDPDDPKYVQHGATFLQTRAAVGSTNDIAVILDEFFTQYQGRLEYTIGGDAVDALDEALSIAKAGEMSITPAVYDLVQRQSMNLTFERRRRFFVIKNITEDPQPLRKNNSTHPSPLRHGTISTNRKNSPLINTNAKYLKTLPGLQTDASKMAFEPLIPRVRNTSHMNLPVESNRYYFKYINRSALYRMQHSVDGNLSAQFRDVTIMFVSLGKTEVTKKDGLNKVQRAVSLAIATLAKYEGMLQQFAIDDKGATLLAVFGLPPLSHEREAVFAAKAALHLRDSYHAEGFQGFAIALSTGTIFTAVLPQGSPYRRDPSIAGDAIIVAVRMLKFPFSKENVVCDASTKKQIGGLCEFEDFGENFVKGKVKPVQIFGISKFGPPEKDKRISILSFEKSNDFIGYKSEMQRATHFVDDWNDAPNHHFLVVSGPSGVGKSFFCNNLHKMIATHGVYSCWSSSTEVEKSSKYYLLRNIMLALFEVIDSDKVPQKTTARSDTYSQSTNTSSHHFHLNQSTHSVVGSNDSVASSPSSGSFPTTKEWFKRLASYTSMSPSSMGSNSNHAEITNEIVELILRCLLKCGEEGGYMPLFKDIFTTLSEINENRYTRLLDGRARDILLTGVITRMAQHVSKHVGLVVICDDVQ